MPQHPSRKKLGLFEQIKRLSWISEFPSWPSSPRTETELPQFSVLSKDGTTWIHYLARRIFAWDFMGWWSRANNPERVKTYVTSVVDKPVLRSVHELKDGKKPNKKWPGSASLTSQVTSAWNKTYLKMKPWELLCAFYQPISQMRSIWSHNFAVLVEVHQWDLQQLRKLKVSI